MKILYDLSYAQGGKFFSGLYEYGKKVFKELNKQADVTLLLLQNEKIDEWIVNEAKNIIYLTSPKWSKSYFDEIEKVSEGFDILYFPCQLDKGMVKTKAKLIFTIHDLCGLDLAKFGRINQYEGLFLQGIKGKVIHLVKQIARITGVFYHVRYKRLKANLKRMDKIITISEYSKSQILKTYPFVDEKKITICYSPIKITPSIEEFHIAYQNYNLMVSASRYTKNTYRAILALEELYDEGNYSYPTIIAGNLPEKVCNKIKHKDDYVFLDYVDEQTLEALYKNAHLFIFPSLAEGFGSPPLEAMKYGTKTITSTAMSLKELYHDTIQFDPYDIKDIKKAILQGDSLTREQMLGIYEKISKQQDIDFIKQIKIIKGEEL